MAINRTQYLAEMQRLLANAKKRWLNKHPDVKIYSINIWTDPQTQGSAVNFDTRAHSKTTIAHAKRFARHQRSHALREGNKELANLFDAWKKIDRETNPTEFEFAQFAKANHRSFDEKWGKSARCWPALDPLLLQVRETAAETFADLPLDRDAEISINSRQSWCSRSRKLKAQRTKRSSNQR